MVSDEVPVMETLLGLSSHLGGGACCEMVAENPFLTTDESLSKIIARQPVEVSKTWLINSD